MPVRYNGPMTTAPPGSQSNALLALLAFAALSAGLLFAVWKTEQRPDVPGLLWPDPPQIGAFSLIGSDGQPYTEAQLRGHWTFLFFGFAQCPDVCPGTLAVLKQVKAKLEGDPAFGADGQVLFVSIDPERDTPATLGPYVQYFDPTFKAATGPEEALTALTRPLGVIYARVPGGGADYSMDHTASIFLIDPQLRVLSAISLPHEAQAIADRFRAIAAFVAQLP